MNQALTQIIGIDDMQTSIPIRTKITTEALKATEITEKQKERTEVRNSICTRDFVLGITSAAAHTNSR